MIEHYRDKVVPALQEKFGIHNRFATPRLEKIVISMGLGKIATSGGADSRAKFEQAEKELGIIAGQKPVRCKAKKSVANFKVREGQETGLKVTLRGNRMYEFLDRLISLAIPRVKDFRGLDPNGFDKVGQLQLRVHRTDGVPGSGWCRRHVPAGHEHHDGDDRQRPGPGAGTAEAVRLPLPGKVTAGREVGNSSWSVVLSPSLGSGRVTEDRKGTIEGLVSNNG